MTLAVVLVMAPTLPGAARSGADDHEIETSDEGEVWATGEAGGAVHVVHGMGSVETISGPTISRPHIVTFSPRGSYAYVSDVGNGKLNVLRTADRMVVESLDLSSGGSDTHQAKPSPDGTVLLVARRGTARTLHKILVDEGSASFLDSGALLNFGDFGYTPICSVFSADGHRAYVSVTSSTATPPHGIAVVDVGSMTLVPSPEAILPTDGAVACGMAESRDGDRAYVVSNGGSGHLYALARSTGTLTEIPFPEGIGAADLHYAALGPSEAVVYASSRGNDQLKLLWPGDTEVGTIAVDPTPALDKPDGVAVKGQNVYVAVKDAGKLALVKPERGSVTYLDVAPPAPNALSHVTVRPSPYPS